MRSSGFHEMKGNEKRVGRHARVPEVARTSAALVQVGAFPTSGEFKCGTPPVAAPVTSVIKLPPV